MISEEDIPEHWSLKPLDDITNQIQTGGTPKRTESSFWGSEDDTPWRTSTHFNQSDVLLEPSDDFVTSSGAEETTIAEPEDVLLVTRVNVGYVAVPNERTGVNQDIKVLRLGSEVTPHYLARYLTHYASTLTRKERGAVIKGITTKDVKEIPVPVPPLEEQVRIVSVLDDAFESLDRVDDLSTDVSEYTDAFTNGVLHRAFYSEKEDTTAEEKMPDIWKFEKLSSVAEVNSGSGFSKDHQGHTNKPIPFYKVSDMNNSPDGIIMEDSNNYVDKDILNKLGADTYAPGSTIFPKVGEAVHTNKKRILRQESAVDNNVMCITPNEDRIHHKFLYYVFRHTDLGQFTRKATVPSIRLTDIRNYKIPIPSLEEQERIVSVLDDVFESLDRVEELITDVSDYGIELRASLLQQAFTGQLLRD